MFLHLSISVMIVLEANILEKIFSVKNKMLALTLKVLPPYELSQPFKTN